MRLKSSLILCCIAVYASLGQAARKSDTGDSYSCDISGDPSRVGFDSTFYQFSDAHDTSPSEEPIDANVMTHGYKSYKVKARGSGVIDPQIKASGTGFETSETGTVFNTTFQDSNFISSLTGFFKAPESGEYEVAVTNVDDDVYIFFADSSAFYCCDTTQGSNDTSGIFSSASLTSPKSKKSIFLQSGLYYPLRIMYDQRGYGMVLNWTLTTPSGKVIYDDWSDYIFQFDNTSGNSSNCPATQTSIHQTTTTTKFWTGSGISTSYATNSDSQVTVIVETPMPTTTKPWTGSFPTTILSSGPSGGEIIVETPIPTTTTPWTGSFTTTILSSGPNGGEYIVETPIPRTTEPWTGTFTTTILSSGPNGGEYIVETPTDVVTNHISTTTEPWTGTFTTTILSSGPNGGEYIVETPIPRTTEPWTGTFTTSILSSGPNGGEYIVETPIPRTTEPWTGTGTITTLVPNPTGPGSIYEVKTPGSSIDTTIPWTGSITVITTFTSNGIEYIEHKTPCGTITTQWTGANTITTLVSNPTGSGSRYEVLTPQNSSSVTITVIKPCTGQQTSTFTTTSGCTVAVVVENPKVTKITTITDCNCSENATTAPLLAVPSPATTAPVEIYQGAADILASWSLTAISSMVLLLVML